MSTDWINEEYSNLISDIAYVEAERYLINKVIGILDGTVDSGKLFEPLGLRELIQTCHEQAMNDYMNDLDEE